MSPSCGTCGREMRPLFTGFFCPADCDRKPILRVGMRIRIALSEFGIHDAVGVVTRLKPFTARDGRTYMSIYMDRGIGLKSLLDDGTPCDTITSDANPWREEP